MLILEWSEHYRSSEGHLRLSGAPADEIIVIAAAPFLISCYIRDGANIGSNCCSRQPVTMIQEASLYFD